MKPISSLIRRWREDFRVFRFYFRKYRSYYLIGITSLVIVDALEALPPLLLMSAVDGITKLPFGAELNALMLKLAGAYMAVAVLQSFMRFLWRRYIIRTSMFASNDMRQELFVHLSSMAPGFFKKKRVGELVSLATNDIEAVRFALGPGALVFFDAMFYFLAIPPIMLWISPQLTLISFIPLFFVPWFVRKMESRIQKHFREVQESFSTLASHCQEALGGVRVIKGSSLELFKDKEFARLSGEYVAANMRSVRTQATLTTVLEAIVSSSTILLFLVAGSFVIGEKISIGVFVAFQKYIQKMSWPMEAFGMAANIFQRSIASQKRVDEVLLEKAGILDPAEPRHIAAEGVPAIEVRELSFTYPGATRPALANVSFKVPAGARVGLAGGVGSGKSTLLACLARMEPVPRGSIFFDGVDVLDLPLSEVRRRIAFVPQESFLFSRSIEANVLYGSPESDALAPEEKRAQAKAATRLASVEADVENLARGFDTKLGERGVNLSGGQRQRLTIARAIARKPQVLLLDDCMSAVDSETERRLVGGMLEASSGISLLLASHRTSSFGHLDWLILLEEGRVRAQGKAAELANDQALAEIARKAELERMDLLK